MRNRIAAAAFGLVFLMGLPALAQTGNTSGQSKSQSGDTKNSKDSGQAQGPSHTIRGELAAVSAVGETMVDYSSGRGVVAELTYLTILGSPSGHDSHSDADKGKDHGDASSNGRRRVYEIAIGPETQVRDHSTKDSGDAKGSAKEKAQAALDRLQLGDRVEVEFTRMNGSEPKGSGGDKANASASHTRHGRHRIVRGVAKSVTILSVPDQGGDHKGSDADKGGNASSGGSGSKDKSSGDKK